MKKFLSMTIALFIFCSCTQTQEKMQKPKVLVSVEPYLTMTYQISGDKIEVQPVIPAGVDPHHWEPTITQMSRLQNASIWFTIGESFEEVLYKSLKEKNSSLENVALYNNIKRLKEPSGHCSTCFDTHMWLSPKIAIKQAKLITQHLSSLLPLNAKKFKTNFETLEAKLLTLDNECREALANSKGKILVTSHGAYTYFCNEYGLDQLVIEPYSGKEPQAKELTKLILQLEQVKPKIVGIFLQPQHSNKAAKLLSDHFQIPIYTIDPLNKDYTETIRALTEVIAKND